MKNVQLSLTPTAKTVGVLFLAKNLPFKLGGELSSLSMCPTKVQCLLFYPLSMLLHLSDWQRIGTQEPIVLPYQQSNIPVQPHPYIFVVWLHRSMIQFEVLQSQQSNLEHLRNAFLLGFLSHMQKEQVRRYRFQSVHLLSLIHI